MSQKLTFEWSVSLTRGECGKWSWTILPRGVWCLPRQQLTPLFYTFICHDPQGYDAYIWLVTHHIITHFVYRVIIKLINFHGRSKYVNTSLCNNIQSQDKPFNLRISYYNNICKWKLSLSIVGHFKIRYTKYN